MESGRHDVERPVLPPEELYLPPDALRERGLGYLALGHLDGARQDLADYLVRNADADDAGELRAQLLRIGGTGRATH